MNAISFVFIDGKYSEKWSDITLLPSDIEFHYEQDQILLRIPKNKSILSPIHFKYLNGCSARRKVILEENSVLSFMEEYISDHDLHYVTHSNLELRLNKNSTMHYYKIQNENQKAFHENFMQVEQQEASDIKMFFADRGSMQSKSDVSIHLSERNAACCMNGLYFLNHDNQHVDNTIRVEHIAELGTSSMNFKGVLDKKTKAEFSGKVYVHKNAKRTSAHQENHNLLLSSSAEVCSEPQLEIYADDIKCTHGATVGQLNQDSLFYLRSRGIDQATALKMLTDAFVTEIMDKVTDLSIRNYIQQRVAYYEVF